VQCYLVIKAVQRDFRQRKQVLTALYDRVHLGHAILEIRNVSSQSNLLAIFQLWNDSVAVSRLSVGQDECLEMKVSITKILLLIIQISQDLLINTKELTHLASKRNCYEIGALKMMLNSSRREALQTVIRHLGIMRMRRHWRRRLELIIAARHKMSTLESVFHCFWIYCHGNSNHLAGCFWKYSHRSCGSIANTQNKDGRLYSWRKLSSRRIAVSWDILTKQNIKRCQSVFIFWAEFCSMCRVSGVVKIQVKCRLSSAAFRQWEMLRIKGQNYALLQGIHLVTVQMKSAVEQLDDTRACQESLKTQIDFVISCSVKAALLRFSHKWHLLYLSCRRKALVRSCWAAFKCSLKMHRVGSLKFLFGQMKLKWQLKQLKGSLASWKYSSPMKYNMVERAQSCLVDSAFLAWKGLCRDSLLARKTSVFLKQLDLIFRQEKACFTFKSCWNKLKQYSQFKHWNSSLMHQQASLRQRHCALCVFGHLRRTIHHSQRQKWRLFMHYSRKEIKLMNQALNCIYWNMMVIRRKGQIISLDRKFQVLHRFMVLNYFLRGWISAFYSCSKARTLSKNISLNRLKENFLLWQLQPRRHFEFLDKLICLPMFIHFHFTEQSCSRKWMNFSELKEQLVKDVCYSLDGQQSSVQIIGYKEPDIDIAHALKEKEERATTFCAKVLLWFDSGTKNQTTLEYLLQQVQVPNSTFRSQPIGMFATFAQLCGPVHQDVLYLAVEVVKKSENAKEKQGKLLVAANGKIQRLRMKFLTKIFQQAVCAETLLSPRQHFLFWRKGIKTTDHKKNNLFSLSRLIKRMATRQEDSALSIWQHWQIICKISQRNHDLKRSKTINSLCARRQHLFSAVWNAFKLNLQLAAVHLSWGKFANQMVLKAFKSKLRREAGIRMYQFGMLNNMRARLQKKLVCLHAMKHWQCTSAH
jgi:hypothetical protein